MIILFRHDGFAQVSIVTGNFIVRDWSMCQAVWRSPLLPLVQKLPISSSSIDSQGPVPAIGSGLRFKQDLLAYLRAYGQKRTGALTTELEKYDFSAVRAALIASIPGKQNLRSIDPQQETLWGWPALRRILSSINAKTSTSGKPHIVMQCSSVASVGEKWMKDVFLKTLATSISSYSSSAAGPSSALHHHQPPKFSLVFPTTDEIRRSVDGYASGGSIHMKTMQTLAQRKQVEYLKPMLCHWAGDHDHDDTSTVSKKKEQPKPPCVREALRRRAAPHIKTYIRFSDEDEMTKIDWAVMTSANLSKQAWGEAATSGGDVRICSYEIGVVVWPALWDDGDEEAEMVPVFGKDVPDGKGEEEVGGGGGREDRGGQSEQNREEEDDETTDEEGGKGIREREEEERTRTGIGRKIRVGLRMPYDLPLVPYSEHEMPWCATAPCAEPDWMGRIWPGFGH
ncbi:MAG: hypothetical protein Q9220_005944 [cf. Caloplaca sp. 1 TL-2023]